MIRPGIGPTLAVLALIGCDKEPPEFSGIGKHRFGTTTRGDITDGRCEPTEIEGGTRKATFCFGLQPYRIANRTAEVDLYFEGTEPSGKLIEIQLKIRGCVERDVELWMRQNFGLPTEAYGERAYWQNRYLWAAARLPSDPGRCVIHFLPLSEKSEIARIKAGP